MRQVITIESSVLDLELSARTHNCLIYNGIETVGDFLRLNSADIKLKGAGEITIRDIRRMMWNVLQFIDIEGTHIRVTISQIEKAVDASWERASV